MLTYTHKITDGQGARKEEKSMNKIAAICCYYGKLPEYFSLWAYSAGNNGFIDFYLITDEKTVEDITGLPENVKIKIIPFDSLKARMAAVFDFKVKLNGPYKLCDYKFAYGEIFGDIIKGYDFFGWYDIDVILGDLKKYITEEALKSSAIGELGHFTLLRSSLSAFYRESASFKNTATPYKTVFKTDKSCFFDELYGLNKMSGGIKTYSLINYVADINPTKRDFYVFHKESDGAFIIEYDGKRVYKLFKDGRREEAAYVHLQKRKLRVSDGVSADGFYITPEGFSSVPDYAGGGEEEYNKNAEKLDSAYAAAEKINKRTVFRKKIKRKLKKIFS